MGDDQWAFLWLTLSAPEGTKLPVLGENEHFHMRIRLSRSSEEIRENGGYGTRIQVYDQVPGDNQVQAAFGIQPGIDPEGQIVSITVDQLSYYQNGTEGLQTIQSWSEGITVEDIVLEYPNTVSRIPLELTLPFCDTSAQAVDFKMTPFYFAIDFQMEEPLGQVLEREMFRRMEELPAFDTVKYRTAEREIFSDFEEAALVELHFQDGTVIRPAAFSQLRQRERSISFPSGMGISIYLPGRRGGRRLCGWRADLYDKPLADRNDRYQWGGDPSVICAGNIRSAGGQRPPAERLRVLGNRLGQQSADHAAHHSGDQPAEAVVVEGELCCQGEQVQVVVEGEHQSGQSGPPGPPPCRGRRGRSSSGRPAAPPWS